MVLQLIATVVIKKIYPHTYTSNIFLANFPIMLLPSPQLSSQTIIPSITCNHTGSCIAFKTKYIIICFAQISAYCRVLFTGAFVFVPEKSKNDTAIHFYWCLHNIQNHLQSRCWFYLFFSQPIIWLTKEGHCMLEEQTIGP